MIKRLILVSVPALTIALAQGALAQDTPATEDQSGIRDIIVTATRQSTNLQDTPLAITAVDAQALEETGLVRVSDLSFVVPNATFQRAQSAFGPGVTTNIRGIASSDTSLAGEATVAYYIDDVYYPILLGSNFDLLDIDRVEVLRGPQGTLFGRNTLGGAVNIISRQPSLSDTSGYFEVTVGDYHRRDIRGGINMPISDTMGIMLSGMSRQRDGYMRRLDFRCEMVRKGTPQLAGNFPYADTMLTDMPNYKANDCTIGRLGGDNVQAIGGKFLWVPSDGIRLTISGDYTKDTSENVADQVIGIDPARVQPNVKVQQDYFGIPDYRAFCSGYTSGIPAGQLLCPGDPFVTYATYTNRIAAGTVLRIPGDTTGTRSYFNGMLTRGGDIYSPNIDMDNWGVSGKLQVDLTDQIDLTAVLAYRMMDETHAFDTDGTPLVVEHTLANIQEKYVNAELRLSGKMEWIDWVAGLFYFDADGFNHAINPQVSNNFFRVQYTTYEPTSKAVFANATVRPFGDKLGIVLGARYSDDKKVVHYTNINDVQPNSGDIRFDVTPTDTRFSWKLGLNWEPMDSILIYGSASTGYSLPGFNGRPLQITQVQSTGANDLIAYELGGKFDLFDRRLRLNVAGFYTDFKNRPTAIAGAEALLNNGTPVVGDQQLEPLPDGPPGSTRCATARVAPGTGISCLGRTYYRNLPAKIRGFEAELQAAPIDGLNINANVGYAKFTDAAIAARSVNRRQNDPYWSAGAGIQYRIEADAIGGSVTPRLDWSYRSNRVISTTSTLYNSYVGAYSVFNGRVTYNNSDHDFSISLGATNLFSKFYYRNVFDYQGLTYPHTDAQPAPPREWYLTLSKHF
ncbi:MAG: TonB-dependent receptor [Sphingomonadales bacterium]|nr:TonB-dependent receptor [Sphingomonadales bacterium]